MKEHSPAQLVIVDCVTIPPAQISFQ